jgi:translation initiation factor 4E
MTELKDLYETEEFEIEEQEDDFDGELEESEAYDDFIEGDEELDDTSEPVSPLAEEKEDQTAVRHPLQSSWTLWYDHQDKNLKTSEWSANLNKVLTFDTVEDFWGLYNHIVRATELTESSNYHLFKEHIRPAWEDPENTKGGRWMVNYSPNQRQEVNAHWLYTMLACIGGTFEDDNQICGCVVTSRMKGQFRIAIWTKDASDIAGTRQIGYTLAKALGVNKTELEYLPHFTPHKSSSENDKLRHQYAL